MFSLFIEIPTIIVGTYLGYRSIVKIFRGRYSMLHLCVIIFYLMQILPIFVGYFGSMAKIEQYYRYMYLAMTDELVSIVYALFSLSTIIILWYYAQKYAKINKFQFGTELKKGKKSVIISCLCVVAMLLPLGGVLFAPDPKVYLHFAYFTMNRGDSLGLVYHTGILSNILMIDFVATILFYFVNPRKKGLALLSTLVITWINGKRTLMLFLLLAILAIDFMNWDKQNRRYIKRLIREIIIFGIIIASYYILYKNFTGKSDFADDFLLYSTYFSRLSNVKVSIYDCLYTNNMVAYPFETLLFNLLFFIPRVLWENKPIPFFMRFTYYTLYGSGLDINSSNHTGWYFQVNMWTEFIANAGFIGWLLSVIFLLKVIKISEKSNNSLIFLAGSSFVFLYMMYGFEHIVQMLFVAFVMLLICNYIKNHVRIGTN